MIKVVFIQITPTHNTYLSADLLITMEVILFTVFCIVLAIPVIIIILRQRAGRRKNLPPLKSGWIPWIGVAFDFGKKPLLYINTTRKEACIIYIIMDMICVFYTVYIYEDANICSITYILQHTARRYIHYQGSREIDDISLQSR